MLNPTTRDLLRRGIEDATHVAHTQRQRQAVHQETADEAAARAEEAEAMAADFAATLHADDVARGIA